MKVPNFQSASVLQRIGIAPGLVAIVVIVDSLLFGGEASTLGASLLLSIPVGILLAVIAAFWQRKFYGDSWTRAIVKGVERTPIWETLLNLTYYTSTNGQKRDIKDHCSYT